MKKIILLFLVFSVSYAQKTKIIASSVLNFQKEKKEFVEKNLFNVNTNFSNSEYKKAVENATIASLDLNEVNKIMNEKTNFINLKVPYDGKIISVLLYKVETKTDDFQLDTDKEKNITVEKGIHYRGIIENDINSLASFNFFKNQLNGIISNSDLQNLVIGKIQNNENLKNYIIYSDKNLKIKNNFTCTTKDFLPIPTFSNNLNKTTLLTNHCVTIYFEMDYDLFVANGNSINQCNVWMSSVFNNVQTLYNNDNIKVAIKSVFVWTTLDSYTGTSSVENLNQFHQNRPTFNGDLGQLVAIDGGFGGVATTINGLCSDNNFSYSDIFFDYESVPTYSWTVQVISHELGHLLGSPHTHGCYWNGNNTAIDGCGSSAGYVEGDCAEGPIPSSQVGGTIMSYCHLVGGVGINFANGFGIQPATKIIDAVENANCLGNDCIETCVSFVRNVQIQYTNTNNSILSWIDDSSATEWQVGYVVNGQAPVWTVTNTNPYVFQNINPNSYYFFYVRSNCPTIEGVTKSSPLVITDEQYQNYCTDIGIPFYDSGWNLKNYSDNEDWTRIISPVNPNDKIKVVFESVNLEADYDFLNVYDGLSTNDTLLTSGMGINGTTVQGPFTSTHASGALTFRFKSDQNTNEFGWNATLSCTTLGVNETTFIDFSYFPNPTKNEINFHSKNEIQNISVFTIDGKLLLDKKINQLDTIINLSKYEIGTYIFKIKIENKDFNLKVLKQ